MGQNRTKNWRVLTRWNITAVQEYTSLVGEVTKDYLD